MRTESVYSTASTLSSYARKFARKPEVEIHLRNHTEGRIYTTFDALSGQVNITAPQNIRFDEVQITLEGVLKTYVVSMSPASTASRITAVHNFLRLTMPIKESEYPQPRIAEAGRTYTFSFNFVIPEQLLPKSCSHATLSDHVQHAHLQLPPSLGDRDVSEKDDQTPDMAKVEYAIRVRVLQQKDYDGHKATLTEKLRKLHVVPAQAEAPPMSLSPEDHFTLTKTKSLRKGVFSGKLGKITVSAVQPSALMLPPPSFNSTTPANTVATVNLRFDPHEKTSSPPKLGGLTTKIRSLTFFSVRPQKELPLRNGSHIEFDHAKGAYEPTVVVHSRCVENVIWIKHILPLQRKDSVSSASSSDSSESSPLPTISADSKTGIYYTAQILVPISLPASKTWLPTFHSCILSRVYQLDLSLTVHAPGTGVPSTNIGLHIPVQIGAEGSASRRDTLTAEEAAEELVAAEEFLRPRIIEMPSEELVQRSVLPRALATGTMSELPPSYEAFATARQCVSPGRG